MASTTRMVFTLALGWVAVAAADASAAWNNVFQATCGGRSSASYYFAPPPPAPCCPSVSYVQRCYYQPVTTYRYESYYEPVTTYHQSYYWAPTTSYRYTSYYDPCTGCAQTVATPCTSYYLRSRCNAVQSYVQRCRMVPVTEMRRSFYLEPVVSYYDPCGNPCPSCGPSAAVATPAPAVVGPGAPPPGPGLGPPPGNGGGAPPTIPPAGINESSGTRSPGAAINESSEPPRIRSPGIQERRVIPGSVPATPLRADHVASRSTSARLQGQVVRNDRITPRANATLRFVNEKDQVVVAKADRTGRFAVQLTAGEWTLYAPDPDGKAVFHSTVYLRQSDDRRVTVVSR